MSSNFRTRISRSRSPEDDYSKRSLLAKVNKSELTKLQVAIKRVGLIAVGPNGPLQRGIDDRAKICAHVHVRKGRAPRMPIFSGDIKVNQDFSEDRTVFTHDKYHKSQKRSRSRSKGDHDRSRSRDRNRKERRRSKTSDRSRSRGRIRRRSSSRTRRSPSKYRSRSRERRYSLERSKSRSRSGSSNRYRRRSITPLRPGEYRPGHPDLALRSTNRKSRSKSRSPRNSSRGDNSTSTSRDRVSPGRSRSRRTPSPYSRERRRSRSRHRSPPMQMPKMDYGFYEGFPPMSMNPMFPFRGRFPMVQPGFYPRMYHPNMMMGPRLPMMPRMPRIPIPRRLNIMDNAAKKNAAIKPATITSTKDEKDVIIEHVDEADNNEAVSSSNKHGDSVEISH